MIHFQVKKLVVHIGTHSVNLFAWPSCLHISSWLSEQEKGVCGCAGELYLDALWKERYLAYMKHHKD